MLVDMIPLPHVTELSRPFWSAANEGRLELQRCSDCGKFRWTPQILCPHCLAEEFEWMSVSGKGNLYSFTFVHRAPMAGFETPYALAVVELDEGPLMLTHLVDYKPDQLSVGARVDVHFTRANDAINLYTFRPTAA